MNVFDYTFYRISKYFQKREGQSSWVEGSMVLGALFTTYAMALLKLGGVVTNWTDKYFWIVYILGVSVNFLIFNGRKYRRIQEKLKGIEDSHRTLKGWLVAALLLTSFPAMNYAFDVI